MINKKEPLTAATVQGASEINPQNDCINILVKSQAKLNVLRNVCRELQELGQKNIYIETVLAVIGGADDV